MDVEQENAGDCGSQSPQGVVDGHVRADATDTTNAAAIAKLLRGLATDYGKRTNVPLSDRPG